MKYQKLNIILGWITFGIAAFVYLSTIEPSASFWDCGEFIATGYKLEVGHPPGAPVFMLLTRFFTLFAGGNVQLVPVMANVMSALASAFTILFLFWTITHLARKILGNNENLSVGQIIAVLGSGFVGALAYTFSDTFWFSAVEGEVYASSSLLTAFVFWAILKWENIADQPHSERWIVLMAYVVGLSIGVHLLNLLAIPAMVLVYYFRKFKVTRNGLIGALIISFVILAVTMWGIIPGVVKIGFVFDYLFVNSFGMPFNSGFLFSLALMFLVLVLGIYYSRLKQWVTMNTVLLSLLVLLMGYSSYAVIVIRSNATPPIDQNDPDNPYSLLSYLNREQYGDRPLLWGQYYHTPIESSKPYKEGGKTYVQKDGKYVAGPEKIEYNYNDRLCMFFPRMYSSRADHVEQYQSWAKVKGHKVKEKDTNGEMKTFIKPTFGENLRFFFSYQINWMYWRYFMWNFAGRQNDIQGHGDPLHGNWISGIKFLDEIRLGPQDNLPTEVAGNEGHNKYYFLPFLLGLIGAIFHFKKHNKDFWVVLSLYILTGLAIVVYLNQYPLQPRERDYAYAGSFYAFAIWIGIGVLGIYEMLVKYLSAKSSAIAATVLGIFIPTIMAAENWDDHDRSNCYIARDFAYNYLQSCEKDAVVFTNGDNDTFPLWYIQEVEGVRTDVRVVCLPYLITDWYIDQMKSQYYDGKPVPFSLTREQYQTGRRDQVPVLEQIKDYSELKEVINFVASDDPRTQISRSIDEKIDYFPAKKFKITVDSAKVIANNVVRPEDHNKIVKEIKWNLNSNYIMKNDLMILDLLASADWKRPVYFVSVGQGNETEMRDYFQNEGFAYRFVPIYTKYDYNETGHINTDILYENIMNKFKYGNMGEKGVYLNENTKRTIRIVRIRSNFGRLAIALCDEGKKEKAVEVVKRGLEVLPHDKVPIDYFDNQLVEAMFKSGMLTEANDYSRKIAQNAVNDLQYFVELGRRFKNVGDRDKQVAMVTLQWISQLANQYKQDELAKELDSMFQDAYSLIMMERK